jgi:hypothetical protein
MVSNSSSLHRFFIRLLPRTFHKQQSKKKMTFLTLWPTQTQNERVLVQAIHTNTLNIFYSVTECSNVPHSHSHLTTLSPGAVLSLLDFRPEEITFVEMKCSPASCPNVANQFPLPVSMAVKHFIDPCFLY